MSVGPLIRSVRSGGQHQQHRSIAMKILAALALVLLSAGIPVRANDSNDYPLHARVIAVDARTAVSDGDSYIQHVMKAVIGDHTYGLVVAFHPFHAEGKEWLEIGEYSARRTKKGFEVQYADRNGKMHHETLLVISEEPASQ
jgi:hypothetical protein